MSDAAHPLAQPVAPLRFGAATDVGLRRDTNEDAFAVNDPVYAVADGMGGHLAGEVASELAVAGLLERFAEGADNVDDVIDAVKAANHTIFRESRSDASRHGMGTTLTAIVRLNTDQLALVNVGDSRGYVVRGGGLRQLSIDHSYVQELIERGELKPGDARTHPNRNIVTRALGVEPRIDVDAWVLPMVTGDRYLLCSDGLVDDVLDDAIEAALLTHDDPQAASEALVRLALAAGGRDNITALVVDVTAGLDPSGAIPETTARLGGHAKPSRRSAPKSSDITAPIARHAHGDASDADEVERLGDVDGSGLGDPATQPLAVTSGPDGFGAGGARRSNRAASPAGGASLHDAGEGEPRHRATVSLATVIFAALVAAVFVIAFVATAAYARSGYFVGFQDDTVVIYKGRPGGVLWFDPTVDVVTQIERNELTPGEVGTVENNPEFDNLDRAIRFATDFGQATDSTTPTTPSTPADADGVGDGAGDGAVVGDGDANDEEGPGATAAESVPDSAVPTTS